MTLLMDAQKLFVQSRKLASKIRNTFNTRSLILEQNV